MQVVRLCREPCRYGEYGIRTASVIRGNINKHSSFYIGEEFLGKIESDHGPVGSIRPIWYLLDLTSQLL